jgi:hypothetical protein
MARRPKNAAPAAAFSPPEGEGPRRLIVEFGPDTGMSMAARSTRGTDIAAMIADAGARMIEDAEPITLPGVDAQSPMEAGFDNSRRFSVSMEPADASMLVVAEGDAKAAAKLAKNPEVLGVFADLPIEPCLICPGSPPMGNQTDVARLICAEALHNRGMDGQAVLLAIVDTGINKAHLAGLGITPNMDTGRSWVPTAGLVPFEAPVGHGTMCAYDALIGAPKATLLDIQLLRAPNSGFTSFLSEAVRAFAHLTAVMKAPTRPGETRSLVVNNSWGMFHPTWDFPVGHPGNYSDNPNHPFNRAVATLESFGADILFAAGNCGTECPDGRCQGVTTNTIYGANGHPSVLTVAGVDISKTRVGYSSKGPGRLTRNKPDISGYTHFRGSGVYAADGGTSAACPVVAGVVAAARTKRPYIAGNPASSPHAMRELVRSTATDLGVGGFDFETGFGVVNGCAIADRITPGPVLPNICIRYPWLCRPRPLPIPFPDPPRPGPIPGPLPGPLPPIPGPIPPGPGPLPGRLGTDLSGILAEGGLDALLQPGSGVDAQALLAAFWQMGYENGLNDAAGGGSSGDGGGGARHGKRGCGCGCGCR